MSQMKQHRQDVRQNHERRVACNAVAVGWLSKPAPSKQNTVGLVLCFSLGTDGILLRLVVAIFI